jgi:hypothetical protein
MSRALRTLLAALAAALLVLAASPAGAQLLSPGPLAQPHASVEGDDKCGKCHSSGKRVDKELCLKCHGDVGKRIAEGKGLHGREYKDQPCEKCHADHLGAQALLRWPNGDPKKLDHALTGWKLNGAHKKTDCKKCHTKVNERGNFTFLGLSSACDACHKEPHEGRLGTKCLECHNESVWKEVDLKKFNHDVSRFPLRGAHVKVDCVKCHFEPPRYTGMKFAACSDCHKNPHNGKFSNECADCHENTKWVPVTFSRGIAKHPGVSLMGGHARVRCKQCHDRGNLIPPSRGRECAGCHKPVHKAPFGRACVNCHASIQWLGLPRQVGLGAHPRTAFPLTGKHEGAACGGCHKPELPREARYRKLRYGKCRDCHEDKHRGEFAAKDGGECKPCHTTAGFYPTLFTATSHETTRFPLIGKHSAAPCLACHKGPRPRTNLHVANQACANCHENPHGDQFKKEMSRGGCKECHQPTGWDLPKIDHSIWPLTGVHATAQCDSCHHPTDEDRRKGTGASYRGVPRNCVGCHDDVHLGQFRLTNPVRDCPECHTTKSYKLPDFAHEAVTGWALTGTHVKTECVKCHPLTVLRGETRPTARWRLPSHECRFCHANPHRKQDGR